MFKSLGKVSKIQLFVSLFFALTLCFIAPLHLYINNHIEFTMPFSLVNFVLFTFAFVILIILFLAQKLINKPELTSIIFILSVLLWLQGNILNWKYGNGLLNGEEILWNNYWLYGLIDTTIWISLFILAIIKSKWIMDKVSFKGSLILILSQLIIVIYSYCQISDDIILPSYASIKENQFTFSSDKNAIILVLDSFQSPMFQEIIIEDPKYCEELSGFTYFRNALAGYPNTYPSITFMLTGQRYDNSLPIQDFIKDSFTANSLPLLLKEKGIHVDLYPMAPQIIYSSPSFFSDYEKPSFDSKELMKIGNSTLFRYSPHYLKKYFYNIFGKIDSNVDLEFVGDLGDAKVLDTSGTFKLYHLNGAHNPYVLNEKLEVTEMDNNIVSYKIQAKAALEITKRFLRKLKEMGIYDNSLIFIVADHGTRWNFGPEILEYQNYGKFSAVPNGVLGSALPLMLVKPIGAQSEFNISDVPVSLSDIPKTAAEELNIENQFGGTSVFQVSENEERERRFLYFEWTSDYWSWSKDYMPSMKEFIISGNSWLYDSWKQTGRIYTQDGVKYENNTYNTGEKIGFGKDGSAYQYQGNGWSSPEEGFTWTAGNTSFLRIPLHSGTYAKLQLQAIVSPLLGKGVDSQDIIVYMNNQEVGRWVVKEQEQLCSISIPNNLIEEDALEIGFEIPNAITPLELGINADTRRLGIAFQSVQIIEDEN